jgi:hypothetical protein
MPAHHPHAKRDERLQLFGAEQLGHQDLDGPPSRRPERGYPED